MSKLEFRYGAMNSSKSAALNMVAFNYRERGGDVLTAKPRVDDKGESKIVSRTGMELDVDIWAPEDLDLYEAIMAQRAIRDFDAVLTDESQFFAKHQINELLRVAKLGSIPVIAFGIRTDFQTNDFPGSRRLMELADTITELPTVCRCRERKARFNTRLVNGEIVFDGDQVAIDGKQQVDYISLCAECYLAELKDAGKELPA